MYSNRQVSPEVMEESGLKLTYSREVDGGGAYIDRTVRDCRPRSLFRGGGGVHDACCWSVREGVGLVTPHRAFDPLSDIFGSQAIYSDIGADLIPQSSRAHIGVAHS